MNLQAIGNATKGKVKTSGVSPFQELPIEKVYPNPNQPRKSFNNIEELAATISEHGLLQPISVVKKDDGYMITAGERRYRAHLFNNAKTIKSHIVNLEYHQVKELALIENIQRDDLTDFEKAKYIGELWASGEYEKKSDLAAKIGKSPSYISKAFGCLKLDSEIIKDIEDNKNDLPLSVLEEIARVKDTDIQKEVYEKYLTGEIIRDQIKDFKLAVKEQEPKDKRYDEVFEVDESENFPREKFNWNIQGELDDFEVWDGINAQLVEMKIKSPNLNIKITIEEV
ncbi:hypothetical protein CPG37_04450 [Malaciobacter canalis]|uniref:ParB-like N-terminal domain-containing protein n=1 Tax=Malaciobacter canalis TaxID=1912871 RepID=A0ABX4LQU4_9BACT|nr:ParB/RepB/Spo0J family partition protein [Malaciobacter canalis]PHO10302.1 hypothetical protein CPG37_04450 [Malaciobacter canalis]QEE32407.1 ParB-like nuclease domain-containing protein [Malaciobacter canalis]